MRTICLEIRDSMTFIPCAAMDVEAENENQRWLLAKSGYIYGNYSIILVNLNDCRSANDPHSWRNSRTMTVAHQYIEQNWNELRDGDVIDVEFILGESTEKKVSERFE